MKEQQSFVRRLQAELTVIPPVTRSMRAWWRTDEPAPWQQKPVWMVWRPKIAEGAKTLRHWEMNKEKSTDFQNRCPNFFRSEMQFSSQTAGGSQRGPGCATAWFLGISVPSGCSMRWDCPQASLPHWANRSPWRRPTRQVQKRNRISSRQGFQL